MKIIYAYEPQAGRPDYEKDHPIFIKFSKDHAYFLTHRKMYNLCPNSWIFIPKNGLKNQQPSCRRQNRPNSQHVPTTLKSN